MGKGVVVVLEDEDTSMGVFRWTLQIAGYECAEARTRDEAVEHCRNHGGNVKVLVADLILPTCRGTDVALAASRLHPALRVLFVSGTPVEGWTESDLRKMAQLPPGTFAFIGKPFHPRVLLSKLEQLLNSECESQHA